MSAKVTLRWDCIEIASQIVDERIAPDVNTPDTVMIRPDTVMIRLSPDPAILEDFRRAGARFGDKVIPTRSTLSLYEQTLIQVEFTAVDALGRRIRR